MSKLSLSKEKIRVVLMEGVHQNAVDTFKAAGYSNIEYHKKALDGDALIEAVRDAHMIGIRSRTQLTEDVLEQASKVLAIGCFCIGTNQVNLKAAQAKGVPVFNAPYSNTRSVAELVLAQAIMMMRGIPAKSAAAHRGEWLKTAVGSYEVRGKVLGIVGYGHIGSQVSVLAEALGFNVRYYDVERKLAMGNARPCDSLDDLLAMSDVLSLHVPATPQTKDMIGTAEFDKMKDGICFMNAARGNIVDIDALVAALNSGKVAGAALDVFPTEPASNKDEFISPLRGHDNVILTPHVGGSTQEAQANIGLEVSEKLVRYSDDGSTTGAVNFMEVSLPNKQAKTRFMHVHRNVPGVLSAINDVFSERDVNIVGQYLQTDGDFGYVVVDVDSEIKPGQGFRQALNAIDGTVRVRFLY